MTTTNRSAGGTGAAPGPGGPGPHGGPDVTQAWQVLALVDDAAKHADAKSGVTLAATGLVGGTLYRLVESWVRPGTVPLTCLAVSGLLLLCAGICAGIALVPRTGGPGGPPSLLHFGRIAHAYPDGSSYVTDLAALTANREALFRDIATQAWGMARVVRCKFQWGGWGVRCLLAALLTASGAVVSHLAWPH
jgi:hypothetical protein